MLTRGNARSRACLYRRCVPCHPLKLQVLHVHESVQCTGVEKCRKAAGDDSIKTLTALAVDEFLLNGSLENARLLYQVGPLDA